MDVQSLIDGMDGIAYVVDAKGIIRMIGTRHWNAFAAGNGGGGLVDGAGVLGQDLFSIIAGDRVRDSYRRLFNGILAGDYASAALLSRCDSPGVRRALRISLTPLCHGGHVDGVLVQSVALSEDVRPPIDLFDFTALNADLAGDRARPLLSMCSYCQDVFYPAGSDEVHGLWIPAEEYYRRGGTSNVRISHGICDPCWDRAARSVETMPAPAYA